jgi:hypothetical protein
MTLTLQRNTELSEFTLTRGTGFIREDVMSDNESVGNVLASSRMNPVPQGRITSDGFTLFTERQRGPFMTQRGSHG